MWKITDWTKWKKVHRNLSLSRPQAKAFEKIGESERIIAYVSPVHRIHDVNNTSPQKMRSKKCWNLIFGCLTVCASVCVRSTSCARACVCERISIHFSNAHMQQRTVRTMRCRLFVHRPSAHEDLLIAKHRHSAVPARVHQKNGEKRRRHENTHTHIQPARHRANIVYACLRLGLRTSGLIYVLSVPTSVIELLLSRTFRRIPNEFCKIQTLTTAKRRRDLHPAKQRCHLSLLLVHLINLLVFLRRTKFESCIPCWLFVTEWKREKDERPFDVYCFMTDSICQR